MIYARHRSRTFILSHSGGDVPITPALHTPRKLKKMSPALVIACVVRRQALSQTFFVSPHAADSTTARGFLFFLAGAAFQSILVTHSNGIFSEFPVRALFVSKFGGQRSSDQIPSRWVDRFAP